MADDRFLGRTWFDREECSQSSFLAVRFFARFDRTYLPYTHVLISEELEHFGKHLIPQVA